MFQLIMKSNGETRKYMEEREMDMNRIWEERWGRLREEENEKEKKKKAIKGENGKGSGKKNFVRKEKRYM